MSMNKYLKIALLSLFIGGVWIYHSYVIHEVEDIYPLIAVPVVSYGGLMVVIYWIWSDLRS